MSKIDVGPLAGYNSLTDKHLAGYFNNTRMRRHLIKSGLITRQGEVVPESVYRLNTSRKDHRRNVRDLLAQAIVHKTLDMERSRQVTIRRKLEEISKIELVRRVRMERHRKGDEDLIPLMSPRVRRPKKSPNRLRDSQDSDSEQGTGVDPIYVDEDGMPISPDAESRARLLRKFPNEEIDSKHLYALDSVALREYAKVLERYEKGRVAKSPYLMAQIPRPPTAAPLGGRRPHPSGGGSARHTKSAGSKKQGALLLHRPEPALMHQSRVQSLCEVEMRYYGQQIFTGRDDVDPAQEVIVEQQHCGGNTLTVFKRRILPGTVFSFFSRRHRGYPFSLTFFINGVKDSRLSTCCEYRHSKGARLGGKQGHFGVVKVTGAAPCYKCQVERGSIQTDSKKEPKPSKEEEYKDDFEDEKATEEEQEKNEDVKSNRSSSSSSSDSGSGKASRSRTPDHQDGDEEKSNGRPLGFSDHEDEEKKVEEEQKASSPPGEHVPVPSDSGSEGQSPKDTPRSKGSSGLVEPDTVTVPVEDDEEKIKGNKTEVDGEIEEEQPKESKLVIFSVFTGDDLGAGTDSKIFCRLIGTEGTSDVIQLGANDGDRHFERGSIDSFRQPVVGLNGRPKQLEIWHDGSGLGATWLLDKVLIVVDEEEYEFIFRNWIEGDTGEGDHHHIIDVTPIGTNQPTLSTEDPLVAARPNSSSSSSSSEESSSSNISDEEIVKKDADKVAESSSPSSSSEESEDENELVKSAAGGSSESGPHGGFDPDYPRNGVSRPILADDVDNVERFNGDVMDFVSECGGDRYSVEVFNYDLTDSQLSQLASVMSDRAIECVNIRNGRIDDDKLRVLLDVLTYKQELKLLNLNCNRVGPKGAALIAENLPRWHKLELLLLHGNPLLDDGIDAIVSAIIDRKQRLDSAGIQVVPLRSLDLGDSEMTNQGAYMVCRLLAENIPLESLELTGNRKIGLDGWRQLGEALGTNTCLRTLSVDYCSLRDDQLTALVARLANNETLQSLDLEGNELSDEGGHRLRQVLVENGTLSDVSLKPGNLDLSDDLSEEVTEMASKNAED